MRSILYLLLAAVLLSTELTSCITDHRSVSPSPGQNYQLTGYVINSSSYSPAQSVGSLTLQRDNNGRILRAISAITYPNNPRTQLTQIFSYNTDNLLVESKVILDSAYFSIASGLGERRVYEYENQRIKTIRKFNNNAYNPNLTSIIYEDQVTYDAQGRLAKVNRNYYNGSYTDGPTGTSILTYEYDGRNNPIVVNELLETKPGYGNRSVTRKYQFEYDDKPNALTQIDLLSPTFWALNNPFDQNNLYIGTASNNPTKQSLTSSVSSENSVYNFTYEYKDGLVSKASFPIRYFNTASDDIVTYQFSYNPH